MYFSLANEVTGREVRVGLHGEVGCLSLLLKVAIHIDKKIDSRLLLLHPKVILKLSHFFEGVCQGELGKCILVVSGFHHLGLCF